MYIMNVVVVITRVTLNGIRTVRVCYSDNKSAGMRLKNHVQRLDHFYAVLNKCTTMIGAFRFKVFLDVENLSHIR